MHEIKQTIEHEKEPQFQITVDGEVVIADPSYMRPELDSEIREGLIYRFDGTGVWDVKVTPLMSVPDHRNGALVAVRSGTGQDAGEWIKDEQKVYVDSALTNWEDYREERQRVAGFDMAAVIEVDGTLLCSSGLGDGAYDVYVRRDDDGQVDGVKVDFTPSDAAMSLLYH